MNLNWKKLVGLVGQLAVDFSNDDAAAQLNDVKAIVTEVVTELISHPVVGPKLVGFLSEIQNVK